MTAERPDLSISTMQKTARRALTLNALLAYRFGRLKSEWLIIYSFLGLSLIGAALLLIPAATAHGRIPVIDALFTATSAVCVTGLTVVDTGTYYTGFGQSVILILIQLGGFEGAGSILLFSRGHTEFPPVEAATLSVFHSVSAFCNAGFSLFHNSLMDYKADVLVNFVVIGLIFLGGIGFLVIHDVERWIRYRKQLSLHSRLALTVSAILIVSGAALFLLFEWRNALTGYSWWERVIIALFQSVTSRTAGFNTVHFSILTNSSMVLIMFLMWVGGSPGSTAGGVKTTTFAILIATAISRIQGQDSTNIWRRTIPAKIVSSMVAIVLISISVLFLFYFLLQWTEGGWIPHTVEGHRSLELAFEATSAFGTVGLSAGITPHLTFWGKVQIIILMLVGRIGPLAISVAIARRHTHRAQYEYYRENVMVG
ncbi:MAG: potassium transporter TrkG [Acidobacteriota bacterium]